MRAPFPTVFDSSSIAAGRSCGQKFHLEYVEHYKPGEVSVHLHAGGAYAHGLEAARRAHYVDGQDELAAQGIGLRALMQFYGAFECPPDSAKSLERTAGALEYYFSRYPLASDMATPIVVPPPKMRGVEMGFTEIIDLDDPEMTHPETGDPLLYAGRADMLVDYQNMVLGLDDKTTSSLGASWSRQWDLRSQFTGYSWGFRRMGIPIQGWLVRGVSILKTKYDTLEAITYRPTWQIDRWHEQLKRDIIGLKRQWAAGLWDFNLDHACTEFGGCGFRQACLMRDPQPILDQQFTRRKWDPVLRLEVPMEVRDDQLVEREAA